MRSGPGSSKRTGHTTSDRALRSDSPPSRESSLVAAAGRFDPDGAIGYAEECLALAEDTDSPKNVVKARRLRGQSSAMLDEVDAARAELAEAVDLARRVANPPQLWRTLAAAADLHDRLAEPEPARAHAKEALEVVQAVADRLDEDHLRETLLAASEVSRLRRLG